jgi:hypothetical protein
LADLAPICHQYYRRFRLDQPQVSCLDPFFFHMGKVFNVISVPLDSYRQLGLQLADACSISAYSFTVTLILCVLIDYIPFVSPLYCPCYSPLSQS